MLAECDERRITASLVSEVIDRAKGNGTDESLVEVIDAFQVPRIMYDPIRKLFHKDTKPRKLFGDGQSKVQLYIDRFSMIQQRLRRHKLFRPTKWNQLVSSRAQEVAELTELKALLGCVGERRFVIGFLSRQDEDRYFIEDLSACLPLDLQGAETTDGIFPENSIVVAEGELTANGTFRAFALGLPPAEPRAESLSALQGLNMFGGHQTERSIENVSLSGDNEAWDRIIVLSDVFLDRLEVMDRLRLIFDRYSSLNLIPSAFVLMGNFQSYDAKSPAVDFDGIRDNFAELGRLISRFPDLVRQSKFILIPGPGDITPHGALPRPGLPRSIARPLLEAVPGVVLASNPCRIRHGRKELVLFRFNLQRMMRGLCILPSKHRRQEHILSSGDPLDLGAALLSFSSTSLLPSRSSPAL